MTRLLFALASLARSVAMFCEDSQSWAWHDGNDAYYAGKAEDSNPYYGDEKRKEWLAGYRGQKQ